MFATTPTCVASVTAITVAEAPGARRPRSQVYGRHVPCDARSEISRVRNERGSSTFTPLTSAAATDDRLVTIIVQVRRLPTTTVSGSTDLVTSRSSCGAGPGGVAGTGGGSGSGGVGGSGCGGCGGVPLRVFVKVQTTLSSFAIVPSSLVPWAETVSVPFVHSTFEV